MYFVQLAAWGSKRIVRKQKPTELRLKLGSVFVSTSQDSNQLTIGLTLDCFYATIYRVI